MISQDEIDRITDVDSLRNRWLITIAHEEAIIENKARDEAKELHIIRSIYYEYLDSISQNCIKVPHDSALFKPIKFHRHQYEYLH